MTELERTQILQDAEHIARIEKAVAELRQQRQGDWQKLNLRVSADTRAILAGTLFYMQEIHPDVTLILTLIGA